MVIRLFAFVSVVLGSVVALGAEAKEVLPLAAKFPTEVTLGEALIIVPPEGIDAGQPVDFLWLTCREAGAVKAVVWVLILPQEYSPNYLLPPVWFAKLPSGRLPEDWRQTWSAEWKTKEGSGWKVRSAFEFTVKAPKGGVVLPKRTMTLTAGATNADLVVGPGEFFALQNPSKNWAGCYPPGGSGEITAGKFEVAFSGVLLVAFFRPGGSNFHDDKETPFGAFTVKK